MCDLPPETPGGERFGPEDYAIDPWADIGAWSDKEIYCRDIGGITTWSTNGAKVCDVGEQTGPGGSFGAEDWVMTEGRFVNPRGE